MTRRFPKPSRRVIAAIIVVIAAVAVFLGKRAHDRRTAIETIQRLGGVISYETRGPLWLASLPGIRETFRFNSLVGARFNGASSLSRTNLNIFLQSLRELNDIEELRLSGLPLEDDDLIQLAHISRLESLDLSWTSVGDDGLVHLASHDELVYLDLSNTAVSDEGLVHLKQMPKLEVLILDGTRITDDGIPTLAELPGLVELSLSNTGVTDEGVSLLADRVANLAVSDD